MQTKNQKPIVGGPWAAGEEFLAEGHGRGRYSKTSVTTYRQTYKLLEQYFPTKLIGEYTTDDLLKFLTEGEDGRLRRDHMGGKTIQGYRNHCVQLFRWAKRAGLVEASAVDTDWLIEQVKPNLNAAVRQGHWITPDELPALVAAARSWTDPDVSLRNEMVLRIGLGSGLRAFELGNLRWHHVDLANGIIFVHQGKGSKDRKVAYLDNLDEPLRAWKARAAERLGGIPTTQFVLPPAHLVKSINGKRGGSELAWNGRIDKTVLRTKGLAVAETLRLGLTPDAVVNLVTKIAQRAGSPVRAHDLRRSFAGQLEDAGVPIQDISKQLGHTSVDVTIRYLADNPTKRREAIRGVKGLFG